MDDLIKDGIQYMCYLGLFTILCSLIYHLIYYIRDHLFVRRNCWFCNEYVKIPFKSRKEWFCIHCNQFNGFTKDGDYTKSIPEQYDEKLNQRSLIAGIKKFQKSNNGLCHICNANQELKIKQLSLYVPYREENYDVEIDAFKKKLEDAYKICSRCERVVQNTLKEKYNLIPKIELNVISTDKKNNSIFSFLKTRQKRNRCLGIGAALLFISFLVPFSLWIVNGNIGYISSLIKWPINVVYIFQYMEQYSHLFLNSNFLSLLASILLRAVFSRYRNKFLFLLAGVSSTVFIINDYLVIFKIPDYVQISVTLLQMLILLLYCIMCSPKTKNSKMSSQESSMTTNIDDRITNSHVTNNIYAAKCNGIANSHVTGNIYPAKCNGIGKKSNSLIDMSVCNKFVNMNLGSSQVKETHNENNFLQIRNRTPIIKPAKLNLRRHSSKSPVRTLGLSSSSSDSSFSDNSLWAYKKPPVLEYPSEFDSVSQSAKYSPPSFNYNPVYKYSPPIVYPSLTSPVYLQYSNSLLQTSTFDGLPSYSIVPVSPCLNHSSSSCSSTMLSTSQHQTSVINFTTIFHMIICCFSCFVLGFCLKELKS